MFERILRVLRDRVRSRRFVVTLHAEEEIADDGLTIFDVERCMLSGRIVERQKDSETGEWKYLVQGEAVTKDEIVVVCKLGFTGKVVIITVYRV